MFPFSDCVGNGWLVQVGISCHPWTGDTSRCDSDAQDGMEVMSNSEWWSPFLEKTEKVATILYLEIQRREENIIKYK